MDPKAIIEAKLRGDDLGNIFRAIERGRDVVSQLPEEVQNLHDSLLEKMCVQVDRIKEAVQREDIAGIKKASTMLSDLCYMLGESVE
jgi:hypothetical protein